MPVAVQIASSHSLGFSYCAGVPWSGMLLAMTWWMELCASFKDTKRDKQVTLVSPRGICSPAHVGLGFLNREIYRRKCEAQQYGGHRLRAERDCRSTPSRTVRGPLGLRRWPFRPISPAAVGVPTHRKSYSIALEYRPGPEAYPSTDWTINEGSISNTHCLQS